MSRYNSRYESRWAPYVPVAERRRKAALAMEKLRKKGHPVAPVQIEGRTIAATFWGKAWCDNLESYHDFANRLERGRTYVRNGSVVDLQIAPREVTAMVSGSSIYKVKVSIGEVAKPHWKAICAECSGGIDSLVELLQGRFSKGVMERLCRQGAGLFPKPAEIRFSCSCPDFAYMCKHVAAVLYGVGARLDTQPELLFRLRAVDEKDLVADIDRALPLAKRGPAAGKVLEGDDMAALFGLDMAGAEDAVGVPAVPKDDPPAVGRKRRAAPAAPVVAAPGGKQKPAQATAARRKPGTAPAPTAEPTRKAAAGGKTAALAPEPRKPASAPQSTASKPAVAKKAKPAARKKAASPKRSGKNWELAKMLAAALRSG